VSKKANDLYDVEVDLY